MASEDRPRHSDADDLVLMGSDIFPEKYERPKGFAVLLGMDDPKDAERIYKALAENGTVQMPLQKTFWATCFAVLVDQFGIPWEINCGQAPAQHGDETPGTSTIWTPSYL